MTRSAKARDLIRSLLLTLLICAVASALRAYPKNGLHSAISRYSIREGIASGVVNSIVQDNDGLMWFGTSDGVSRFDGTGFRTFRYDRSDAHSLSGNYVKSLMRDKQGTIWISSREGFSSFDTEKQQFNRYKPFRNVTGAGNDVSDISQGRNNNLWLALNGSGFVSFDLKTKKFNYFNKKTLPGLFTNAILNTLEDSHGMLWLGSRDSGFEVWENRKGQWSKARLNLPDIGAARIHAFYEDHLQNVWIASSKGLVLFKRAASQFYQLHIKTFSNSDIYLSLLEDQDKNLLVGVQDGGVYRLDLRQLATRQPDALQFEPVTGGNDQGITQRSVQALFVDRDRNIWLGTYGEGTYLISSIPEKFRSFRKKTEDARGESLLRYYGMCTDAAGNLWIGTDGDGIYKTSPNGDVLKHYAPSSGPGKLTDGAVLSAHRDRRGRLWFGTYSKGLFYYDARRDAFVNYAHNAADPHSLPRNDVRVIFQDTHGRIWVGTNGGGLALLDERNGRFKTFLPSNSTINSNDVRAITEDRHGNLWIGTFGGGLNYLNTRTMQFSAWFNQPTQKPFLSNRIIFSVYIDSRDRLWIGSEGNGLLLFDIPQKKTRFFDVKNGLANNVINAILPESADRIWLSTNKGLSRIDLTTSKIENFNISHGLQGGQFNPGSALFNPKTGMLAFGGTEGWNMFDPKSVKPSDFKPKVMLTGVRIFGKEPNGNDSLIDGSLKKLSLQPNQPVFTISYTALNYAYPERTQFAYMMEGLDKTWNGAQNERSATYRYLPAGQYTFKVKASNQDGVWFDDFASMQIVILPPWYQTWWAYLLYILTGALLIYYYQRYRIRQEKMKYEVQLAHLETRQQAELNERKFSFFTNVSHEFRTPLTLIINPARELIQETGPENAGSGKMQIIYRNARRLLSLVDQLLLFRKADQHADQLKPAVCNLHQLVSEVFECFIHQAEHRHIRYTLICEDTSLEIVCDWEKIEIALFNLISNAIKFTPDHGEVLVEVNAEGEKVILRVSDNGPGVPPKIGDDIFKVFHQAADPQVAGKGGFGIGLYLAKTFVESHLGTLTYESAPGRGTIFTMSLWKKHPQLEAAGLAGEKGGSVLLEELAEGIVIGQDNNNAAQNTLPELVNAVTENYTMLIADDDAELRSYLRGIFYDKYKLIEAVSGEEALDMIRTHLPDIVVSDVMMGGLSGIDMCRQMKLDMALSHIPVILLTASTSQEVRLKGIEGGADDYINKPFDKDLLVARVSSILRNRNDLQRYFYNEITLQTSDFKISPEYKDFLNRCISIVENHLTDPALNVKLLASEIGMSHSTLYNRIKSVSGQSASSFIRFIRLRKAAQLLITTDITIGETAYLVGINDIKYFREQFSKLFGMKPSDYIKKYRKPFHERVTIDKQVFGKK